MGSISEKIGTSKSMPGGGSSPAMANVDGLEMVLKRIDHSIKFNHKNMREMRKINRKVVGIYIRTLKTGSNRIIDYKKTIFVKGRKKIEPGTLRKSVGTWTPDNTKSKVLGGPKVGRNASKYDAWYAHIVEGGDFADAFGGKNTSHPNYKKFEKAKKAVQDKMRSKLYSELRKEFERYMR
jgi:hypothetical protein